MAVLKYGSLEEIPEDLRESASEIKDGEDKGKFAVKVSSQKKVDEFRDNNVALAKRRDELADVSATLRKLLGLKEDDAIDTEKLAKELTDLRTTYKLVEDGKLSKSDDIEKELEKRTDKLRSSLEEARVAALNAAEKEKKRADENEARYKRTFIDRDVYQVCSDQDVGIEPWAMPYVLQDAYGLFVVEGDTNKLVPKRDNSVVYGETGGEPMSVKEWVSGEVRKTKPHFFKKSGGGGANGGASDGKQFGGMSKEDFNKLPAARRLQIANELEAKNSGRR